MNHETVRFILCVFISALLTMSCATTPDSAAVDDPFIWLEEVTSERSMSWVKKENDRSEIILKKSPVFNAMQEEAKAILTSSARIPLGRIRGDHVYNFWQDEEHVRGILRRATLTSYLTTPVWETLLDVDALAASEGKNWVYDGYECLPPAYDRCMIGLSPGGTDSAEYREYLLSTKSFVVDGFFIPAAKSSLSWIDENTLLVGTDWGVGMTESGYATSTRLLRRGQDLATTTPLHIGKPEEVGVFANVIRDSNNTYPMTQRVVGYFDHEYYRLYDDGTQARLPLPTKIGVYGAIDGQLFVLLKQNWSYQGNNYKQGSLITLGLDDGHLNNVLTPTASQAIEEVALGKSAIFISLLDDVKGQLLKLNRNDNGWETTEISLPENGVVNISTASSSKNQLLVSFESLTTPNSLYFVDEDNTARVVKSLPEFYDASDVVVEQRFTNSSDGTRIPYFIMAKKSVLEKGNAPTIQYGYGGFEAAILPIYYTNGGRPQHGALAGKLWVSRGGILVLANIRGGGEYGPAWHRSVLVENRQLSFDDFFAVSEALIADGVTSPEKLGAIGRSNGGLLMGVALTQRPELYKAIDIGVPLSDMLRYHKLLAGASWTAEYGNPDIPAERAVLEKYSPYQKIQNGVNYPNVFFYTSTKDDRVHPGHARKMAAKLQQLGQPFLYYENIEGGHGGAANQDQLAYRNALEYIYFYEELF